MKKKIPASAVAPGHPDFEVLTQIYSDIVVASDNLRKLESFFAEMLREEIDGLIDTAHTDRRSYGQLEKVEKTYIGTRIEIRLRKFWGFPKGRLDFRIGHLDVDLKHTMGVGWMIPQEAVDMPCILTAADEKTAHCYMGLVIARSSYLTLRGNRDTKLQLASNEWTNIRWIIFEKSYPPNFWRHITLPDVSYIFDPDSGAERVRRLFRRIRDVPIPRKAIVDVAQQLDPVKRVRANGGARDQMIDEGILVLSGKYDRALIDALGLQWCGPGEFISHRLELPVEWETARRFKVV